MLTFLDVGGGGGGFPIAKFATEDGFEIGFGGGFFRFANGLGIAGAESLGLGIGGAELVGNGGGRGADPVGGRGAVGLEVSESECAPSAPVSIPPLVFLNFGIPAANRPPNCGGLSIVSAPLLLARP